ncbi:MAG: 4-hydroxy-tetrahydrodipicolinate synthase [Hyphomicrobiales bacterium]|nr:MAG: 4-hydroxy-tetrahydrodipicolinate synthase [Hyphomicrobiales bacterium]
MITNQISATVAATAARSRHSSASRDHDICAHRAAEADDIRAAIVGFIPAIPTPFMPDGSVDFASFERFCDMQVRAGARSILVCGTTGEAPTLSPPEQRDLIVAARSAIGSRCLLIAGAGSNATAQAINLSHAAETAGADAILSVVPYYNKPTQTGLHAHFTSIANEVGLPVILYDVPSRTVTGLSEAVIIQLALHPRIVGLKDATGDMARCTRLRSRLGESFSLLSGDDSTALAFIAQGGDGCMSVIANVLPSACRDLFETLQRGQLSRAHRAACRYTELTGLLAGLPNPAGVKFVLSELGWMGPDLRLPLTQLRDADRVELIAQLPFLR